MIFTLLLLAVSIYSLWKARCLIIGHQFIEPGRNVQMHTDGSITETDHIKHYYCMRCPAVNPDAIIENLPQLSL